jgi:guanylate kinase
MNKTPIYIFSWPAWVGKTTLWHAIEKEASHIIKVITTTSRICREWEKDGIDYHFITKEDFEKKIHSGDLIEYAIVHTNYYGSTLSELHRIISLGKSPIYIIEPQGMVHLKPLLEDQWYTVITLFLLPPSLEVLKHRLHTRGTETQEQFDIRLATAQTELEQQDFYDIKIVNDSLEEAKKEFLTHLTPPHEL